VREQRLLEAFRRFNDPGSAHHSISAVAYGCGFSDLSWFNHAFKRRFGRTPSDVREGAEA
jgi:AraC-like DNA-binding protein